MVVVNWHGSERVKVISMPEMSDWSCMYDLLIHFWSDGSDFWPCHGWLGGKNQVSSWFRLCIGVTCRDKIISRIPFLTLGCASGRFLMKFLCAESLHTNICAGFLLQYVQEIGTFLCGNCIWNSYFYISFDDHDLLSGQGHSNLEGFALILMSSLYTKYL